MYSLLGVSRPFDPSDRYTTSWLLSPAIFACLRLFLSIYAFTTIFFIFGWNGSHQRAEKSGQSFSYFTNLTYWGLAFYFLFSALHTFSYARAGRSWLQSWHQPLQAAHTIFYSSIVTFPFLVTIVFWAVLYKGPWYSIDFYAWSNVQSSKIQSIPLPHNNTNSISNKQISQHALNSLFALLEILLPRTNPPPPLHLPFLLLILALYLSLAYLTHATQGFYTYDFLNPAKGNGRVAGYVFGILVATCVIFAIVWSLIWSRKRLTESVWQRNGKFSERGRRREGDIEMREEGR